MSQAEEHLTNTGEVNGKKSISFSDARKQILASCCSFTLVIQVGTSLSFTSVLLPQLDEKTSDISISKEQGSWIGKTFMWFRLGKQIPSASPNKYNDSLFKYVSVLLIFKSKSLIVRTVCYRIILRGCDVS